MIGKVSEAGVSRIRTDWLHKLSTRLVQENQLIATEDLTVKNMVRNRSLARAISDASWSGVRTDAGIQERVVQ